MLLPDIQSDCSNSTPLRLEPMTCMKHWPVVISRSDVYCSSVFSGLIEPKLPAVSPAMRWPGNTALMHYVLRTKYVAGESDRFTPHPMQEEVLYIDGLPDMPLDQASKDVMPLTDPESRLFSLDTSCIGTDLLDFTDLTPRQVKGKTAMF